MIPQADLLTGPELGALRGDVRGIVTDAETGRRVRYRAKGARSLNLHTGAVTPADTDYPTMAVRREAERDQGDGVQLGDYWYMIPTEGLPIGTLGAADQVLDGDDVFNVIRGETDPSRSVWRILTRREKGR